jgi:hypothetical protein
MVPNYTHENLPSDRGVDLGLPMVDGLQAVAHARSHQIGRKGANWYKLEDGTERVIDDEGNATDWPD